MPKRTKNRVHQTNSPYDHSKDYPGFWRFALAIPLECEGHEANDETILKAGIAVGVQVTSMGGFGEFVTGNISVMSPEKVIDQTDAVVIRGVMPNVPTQVKQQLLHQLAVIGQSIVKHRYIAAQYREGEEVNFFYAIEGGFRAVREVDGEYKFIRPDLN